MRLNYDDDDKVEVQMSPLIDCVFLLLIFFLVTTMMKKWEMQIPLTLPTMTSSLSTTRAGKEAVIIAVDEKRLNLLQASKYFPPNRHRAQLPDTHSSFHLLR